MPRWASDCSGKTIVDVSSGRPDDFPRRNPDRPGHRVRARFLYLWFQVCTLLMASLGQVQPKVSKSYNISNHKCQAEGEGDELDALYAVFANLSSLLRIQLPRHSQCPFDCSINMRNGGWLIVLVRLAGGDWKCLASFPYLEHMDF